MNQKHQEVNSDDKTSPDVTGMIEGLTDQLNLLRQYQNKDQQREQELTERASALRRRERVMDQNMESAMKKMQLQREALIRRRRDIARRLRRYRTTLLNLNNGSLTSRIAADDLGKQRRELCQVKDLLEHSETEMVRQWSQRRSIVSACMIMLTLMAITAFSYYAATVTVAPVWEVSMVIQMPRDQWQHRMASNAVLQQVIDQHQNIAANVGDLKRTLASTLHLHEDIDDQLTVSIETKIPQESLALLSALGESAISAIAPAGPISTGNNKPRIIIPAMRSAMPLQDNRYKEAGRIFAALAGMTLLLIMISRMVLARAGRVFNINMHKLMSVLDPPVEPPAQIVPDQVVRRVI